MKQQCLEYLHGLGIIAGTISDGIVCNLEQSLKWDSSTTVRVGRFVLIVIVQPGMKPSKDQLQTVRAVNAKAGIGICVSSINELAAAIEKLA